MLTTYPIESWGHMPQRLRARAHMVSAPTLVSVGTEHENKPLMTFSVGKS